MFESQGLGYSKTIVKVAGMVYLIQKRVELNSFWFLVAMVDQIMPEEYYAPSMEALKIDVKVLDSIFKDKLPRIRELLEHHTITIEAIAMDWMMNVFVSNLPIETSTYKAITLKYITIKKSDVDISYI